MINTGYQALEENVALEWEAEITEDAQSFVELKPGDYEFTVTGYEKERYEGSDKLPPCWKAIVSHRIDTPEGSTTIKENLFLTSKTEWKLSQFFASIGMKKKGEPLKMDWNNIINKRGRATIHKEEYNGREYDRIKNYIMPEGYENKQQSFAPGQF